MNVALACMQNRKIFAKPGKTRPEKKKRKYEQTSQSPGQKRTRKTKTKDPVSMTQRMNFLLCCPKGPAQKV